MAPVTFHPTPNPDSLKFTISGFRFIPSGLRSYRTPDEARGDALGTALLAIPGVADVFVVPDFVTVTKRPATPWDAVVPAVERVLAEHAAASEGAE